MTPPTRLGRLRAVARLADAVAASRHLTARPHGRTDVGEVRAVRKALRAATTTLIVATVAAVLAGGTATVLTSNNAQYANADAAHGREVTSQANALLAATVHTQAGLNGYLATEDSAFLSDYHFGLNDIGLAQDHLDAAVRASDLPQSADDNVQTVSADVLTALRATLATARSDSLDGARDQLRRGRSQYLITTLRQDVAALSEAADSHAARAADRAQTNMTRTVDLLGATGALVLASAAVLSALLLQRGRWSRQREELLAEVAAASLHDPLTGLGNRRALSQHIDGSTTTDPSTDIALVFVDLDGFKAVNDACGHQIGDAYLATVAHRLTAAVRTSDFVCRVGGDEFVVVLHGTDPACDLACVTRRIRTAVTRASEHCERTYGGPGIGASLGISRLADVPGPARDQAVMDVLMREADAAMYAEKRIHKALTA